MRVCIINLILFAAKLRRLFEELEMTFDQEVEKLKLIVIKRFRIRDLEFELARVYDLENLNLDLLNIY